MKCPVCNNIAKVIFIKTVRTFRDKKYEIAEEFYKCKCGLEFTTPEQDEKTINNFIKENKIKDYGYE